MGKHFYFEALYHDSELVNRSKRQVVLILDPKVPLPKGIPITEHLLCHRQAIVTLFLTPEFLPEKGFQDRQDKYHMSLSEWIKAKMQLQLIEYSEANFVVVECMLDEYMAMQKTQRFLNRHCEQNFFYGMWCAIYQKIYFDVKRPRIQEMNEPPKKLRSKSAKKERPIEIAEVSDLPDSPRNLSPLLDKGFFATAPMLFKSKSWTQTPHPPLGPKLARAKSAGVAVLRNELEEQAISMSLTPPNLF